MAASRPPRSSQGTDMLELLRFPDAIEFDKIIQNCNCMAKPIGNRSVTNKCYILLSKATFFSSSLFIGERHVLDTLEAAKDDLVPCLVMLAADTFITPEMRYIINTCKSRDIPYIFIPTKAAMQDTLCVENEVLAVLIAFKHDPGMRTEFEDCFISIKSHTTRKKRKRSSLATSPLTLPSEVAPSGEMPQSVSTAVSTVPLEEAIYSRMDEPGPSTSYDWVAASTDSDYSDESELERTSSKDFSVNVPDESGSSFQEYIRIPSPTPAPSPSEMAAQRKNEESSTPCDTTTYEDSNDESLIPDPSSVFGAQPTSPRPLRQPHRHNQFPIPLPYAPKEDFDDEKVKMYLQTLSKKKKMTLRSKTSVPPSSTTPAPHDDDYRLRRPSTTSQTPDPSPQAGQPQPIDLDSEDFSFWWTMEDLSSTSTDTSTPRTTRDPQVLQAGSSNDELMMDESTPGMLQNEGASGDGNVCPMDASDSSSAVSTTSAMPSGRQTSSSWVYPSSRLGLGDNAGITSTSSGVDVPMPCFHGLGDVSVPPTSKLTDVHSIPSFRVLSESSSDERRTVFSSPRSDSVGDPRFQRLTELPSIPSCHRLTESSSAQSFRPSGDVSSISSDELVEVYSIPSSIGLGDSPSVQSFRGLGDIPPIRGLGDAPFDPSLHALGDGVGMPTLGGLAENPPLRGLGDAVSNLPFPGLGRPPAVPPRRRLYDVPPIPPFRGTSSETSVHEIDDAPATQPLRSLYEVPPIPPFRGTSAIPCNQPSQGSDDISSGLDDSKAGPSDRMDNTHDFHLGHALTIPSGSVGADVPAVPSTSGQVGDAAVIPARPRVVTAGGEGSSQMRATFPTDHGDAWPIGLRNRNVFRHRVSATGEGHQPAFMPTNFSFVFAPRIAYTPGGENGRRRWNLPHGIPSEDEIVAIPFPGEEDSDLDEDDNAESTSEPPEELNVQEISSESNESDQSSDDKEDQLSSFLDKE